MALSLANRLLKPTVRVLQSRQYADQIHPGYAKLKKTQQMFQKDDGCPVWLKKGLSDKLLYYTTVALCGVGMALNIKVGYELIWPTPPEVDENIEED